MSLKKFTIGIVASLLILLPCFSQTDIDQTHSAFTAILKRQVKDDRVDYETLKRNPTELNTYLETLASVPETTFNKWNSDQQMAFYINLYNAATLKLIIDNYPVKSIKDIGNILRGPWKQKVVRVFGKVKTLDYIEHDLLRAKYKDPRIHFAVNCASIGCPPLRPEAFQGATLDTQLDEQGRAFLQDTTKNRLNPKDRTLYLSKIFKWFKKDFTAKSGTVEKFVAPYFNERDARIIRQGGLSIKYTDYDWSLNKQ